MRGPRRGWTAAPAGVAGRRSSAPVRRTGSMRAWRACRSAGPRRPPHRTSTRLRLDRAARIPGDVRSRRTAHLAARGRQSAQQGAWTGHQGEQHGKDQELPTHGGGTLARRRGDDKTHHPALGPRVWRVPRRRGFRVDLPGRPALLRDRVSRDRRVPPASPNPFSGLRERLSPGTRGVPSVLRSGHRCGLPPRWCLPGRATGSTLRAHDSRLNPRRQQVL